MQPTLCARCKKNVAVVFISRMNEKGEPVNEGLCLQCAAKLGLPQVEDMMKRMGITPEDLARLAGIERKPGPPKTAAVPPPPAAKGNLELDSEVMYLKNVGPQAGARLHKLGLHTVRDLILHLPRRWEDRTTIRLAELIEREFGGFKPPPMFDD